MMEVRPPLYQLFFLPYSILLAISHANSASFLSELAWLERRT